ncbi:Helicase conserved C-terminal domain-containing protein [Roseovarius marisflavi]|uniref:Helicase conserved C-terminal domain-containing protein n=1 Tax=Roseovarius marisflavi TaxID=1054996 RepID=A0A1M7DZW2_9RHOB|nr:Helicase conserved C-terminal domain-containing protein [Roseovarius marisflavi]
MQEPSTQDIRSHFKERLGAELALIDGGASRSNLSFQVLPTQRATKMTDILDTIETQLPREGVSGAVVYCATRNATERVAQFLKQQGIAAERYHAGLSADEKREIQEDFRVGNLRVIAATNAFGMGVDKPDIRLVVHGDVPGSLENYLQEAGRAGRDRDPASCVLLYNTEDVDRQFSLSARSRLARHEIGAILKALRRLDTRTRKGGEIVATPGEIVHEEKDRDFQRDSNTDDTRVKTAVAWLEEAHLLNREENRVQVFPASLRIRSMQEAREILASAEITQRRREDLAAIVQHIINAPQEEGITTDELCGVSGLTVSGVRKALADLEALGIAKDDTNITIFVHLRVENASPKRFEAASRLEADLVASLREQAPDADIDEAWPCHLASVAQALREQGHASVRPDVVEGLLRGIAQDGRDMDGGKGNIGLRKVSRGSLMVRMQRSWAIIEQTAQLRRQAAERLVSHLIDKVQAGLRGKDLPVETTLGDLLAAINSDALLRAAKPLSAIIHEQRDQWHVDVVVAAARLMLFHKTTFGECLKVFRGRLPRNLEVIHDEIDASIGMPEQIIQQVLTVDLGQLASKAVLGPCHLAANGLNKRECCMRGFRDALQHVEQPPLPIPVLPDSLQVAIVIRLVPGDVTTEIKDRNVEQSRARQVEHVQNAPDTAIAIRKGMDAFELVMDERHLDERIKIADFIVIHEPLQRRHLRFDFMEILRWHIDHIPRDFISQRGAWR